MKKNHTFAQFLDALETQSSWKKLRHVWDGGRMGDAPSCNAKSFNVYGITGGEDFGFTMKCPFCSVSAHLVGGTFMLEVFSCANPGTSRTKSIKEAAALFANTAWHTGTRGVI